MPARVLLRMLEPATEVLPSDGAGALVDLHTSGALVMPAVVSAFTGFGRAFTAGRGLVAIDQRPGASLLTRTLTVQAIVSWDYAAQANYGAPGAICARGLTGSASEYVAYSLELRVVNLAQGIGELRWWWQDLAGVDRQQLGGFFRIPASGFFLVTATRRWVSSSHVELSYFVGDKQIGSILSVDGEIGGGTTGTFSLGTRFAAGVAGRHFHGVIDQVRVLDEEITREETEGTWRRMAVHQPRGYQALLELLPPGLPISDDPSSSIQRLLRIAGHALGYATAQIENFEANQRPNRAYGPVLRDWEDTTGVGRGRGGDSVKRRRARVQSTFRQKNGARVIAVQSTTAPLLDMAPEQVRVIAYDQTVRDDFSDGLKAERWATTPAAAWSVVPGGLRLQSSTNIPYTGYTRGWYTALQSMQAQGRNGSFIAGITPTSIVSGGEVGVTFIDRVHNTGLLLGLRYDGAWKVISERFRSRVSQGVVTEQIFGGMPAAIWLFLHQQDPGGGAPEFVTVADNAFYDCGWSTVSAVDGYSIDGGFSNPPKFQWAGMYARTIGGAVAAIDATFSETILRAPFGDRSSRFAVFRDPNVPGNPDMEAAHNAIQRIKQAHTAGTAVTDTSLRCDSAGGCDRGPMGAI